MRLSRVIPLTIGCLALLSRVPNAHAQDPTGGALPDVPAPSSDVVPPSLREHLDPVYPPDALRDRTAGSVELELSIDASGKVSQARVVRAAGHGFDEAALAAVQTWSFEPARQGTTAIASTVQLAIPFEPPPAPVASTAPAVIPPAARTPPARAAADQRCQLLRRARSRLCAAPHRFSARYSARHARAGDGAALGRR